MSIPYSSQDPEPPANYNYREEYSLGFNMIIAYDLHITEKILLGWKFAHNHYYNGEANTFNSLNLGYKF